MTWLGYVLAVAAGVGIWLAASLPTWKKRLLARLACTVLLAFGICMTRETPYFAIAGVVLLGASFFRGIPDRYVGFTRRIGCATLLASIAVLIANQFGDPLDGKGRQEDRTDWKPREEVLTAAEVLASPWSTEDKNADWPAAELMLDLSDLAYRKPAEARAEMKRRGFESETLSSGSMNGYVLKAGENAVVLLRGTEKGAYDILQDLLFIRRNVGSGAMHGGFRGGYNNSMHEQVRTLLARYQPRRVWITGHSLGGALAIVCAHDLLEDDDYEIAGVMTFGQPMVISTRLRDTLEPKLKGRYAFFVNDMDPVVKFVEPYVHFGHMVRYRDGKIEREDREVLFGAAGDEPGEPELSELPIMEEAEDVGELDELIKILQSQDAEATTQPQDVPQVGDPPQFRGFLPDASDHYLISYREMIEVLTKGAKE